MVSTCEKYGFNNDTEKGIMNTNLKERYPCDDPEHGCSVGYWKGSRREERAGKKCKKKDCGKKEKIRDLFVHWPI
jgi:hypothetical protein